ncbi:M56 family metallopeptidase [Nonlabens antarcticus]|uniref:M56 family metallopeptidase n=1 Tax=Nonlabens antarcticus TaxID=392714 RepID=UPI001890FC5A|nr:M56 family metallopeptidase [Nonlabens antarcticus]
MEEILSYLLKSAGVLSIFALIYHFLLRRLTFFKANRWFLLFGMLASIAFPLIEITQTVYIERPETVVSPQQILSPMAYVLQESIAEPLINFSQVLLLLYVSISLFFLGKMVVELLSLRRLINSGKRRREDGFVRISLSRKVTPFSFFNYICFYEKEENTAATQLIFKHEQVHAREWHSVDLLLTHIYCAVFWMNPMAWLLKRQIGENLEFIADATAKVENTSGISYERTLLSSAASHMQPALANNFFTPFIKKRIQMLQKETSKKWNAYKYALILPVIVLFLYSFNTVTKTEYVKSKIEPEMFVDSMTLENADSSERLEFDITSETSKAELASYTKLINRFASYNIIINRIVIDGKPMTSISVDFKNADDDGSQSNYPQEMDIKLSVSKDELSIIDEKSGSIQSITKAGLSLKEVTKEFDISSTTSNTDLEAYVKQINDFANYEIKLEKVKDEKGAISLSVSAAFDINGFNRTIKLPISNTKSALILLKVSKDTLRINDDTSHDTYQMDKTSGVKMTSEDWTYNSVKKASTTVDQVRFTISPTTTQESFDRMTKQLKEDHNVDLKISNLQYNDGKIVRIKIELDDNRGFKTSQNLKSSEPIDPICIKGIIEENKKSWSMGNCDDIRVSLNSSDEKMNAIFGSIQDLDLTKMKLTISEKEMSSLKKTLRDLQSDLSKFNSDEISEDLKVRLAEAEKKLSSLNMDSLQRVLGKATTNLQLSLNKMQRDSMMFGNSSVTYSSGNATFTSIDSIKYDLNNLDASEPQVFGNRFSDRTQPLFILNGVETKQGIVEKLNPTHIESVSVLKDESATSLYGGKGKNGVVILTTKVNLETYPDALYVINGKSVNKGVFSKMKPETLESVRILKGEKATSLWGEKGKNGVIVVTTKADKYISNKNKKRVESIYSRRNKTKDSLIGTIKQNGDSLKKNYEERREQLKSQREEIKNERMSAYEERKQESESQTYSKSASSSFISTTVGPFAVTLKDFNEEDLLELKSVLKEMMGVDMDLRTFRKSGNNISKLKFDLDGTTYTFQTNKGIKSLTIKIEGKGSKPKVSTVNY